jgi:hypothetical protein
LDLLEGKVGLPYASGGGLGLTADTTDAIRKHTTSATDLNAAKAHAHAQTQTQAQHSSSSSSSSSNALALVPPQWLFF